MMALRVGKEQLSEEVELIIPQWATFPVDFTLTDTEGEPVDTTGWTVKARLQQGNVNIVLDNTLSCESGVIHMCVPSEVTGNTAIGTYRFDLFADTGTEVLRISAGKAKVIDTYSYDEVE